jgi:cytidine deaminase
MKKMTCVIPYEEYESFDELSAQDRQLMEEAIAATETSYAPYSNFNVGAALRLRSGRIVRGSNQENAAYPSGLCAERTALFYAHSAWPQDPVEALAVVASVDGAVTPTFTYPCGACRQVLVETEQRAQAPLRILVGSAQKVLVFEGISSLLPFVFDNLPEKH